MFTMIFYTFSVILVLYIAILRMHGMVIFWLLVINNKTKIKQKCFSIYLVMNYINNHKINKPSEEREKVEQLKYLKYP